MRVKVQILKARKILVGSVGVAAVSFVGAGCSRTSVANLPAPPSCDVAPNDPYCYPKPDAASDAPDGGADAEAADAAADGGSADGNAD